MLLQVSDGWPSFGTLGVRAILLIAGTGIFFAGFVLIKRWFVRENDAPASVWTLQQLTEMRQSGELTADQYDRLKTRTIGEVQRIVVGGSMSPEDRRDVPARGKNAQNLEGRD